MTDDEKKTISCPQCGAANAEAQRFCSACGARQPEAAAEAASEAPVPVVRRRARRGASGDALERAHGRHEFGRIKNTVLTVRSIFWASAAASALFLAVWYFKFRPFVRGDFAWLRLVVDAVLWSELALNTVGALQVLRSPLVWTTVAACYWTLTTALATWVNDFEIGPMHVLRLFMAVAMWLAVAQAARVQRLMAADPNLQFVRKRIDPARRVAGGVADEARERQRAGRRRSRIALLRLAGVVVAGLLVVGLVIWQLTKPPAADDAVARFSEQWRRSEIEPIAAGLDRSWREELERRGWHERLPSLGEPVIDVHGEAVVATFACSGSEVHAVWRFEDKAWRLARVTLPPLVAPDVTLAFDAFRKAWAAKGTDELVALIRPASRERIGGGLQRILARRGWDQQRPPLGDVDPGRSGGGKARAAFAVGNDEINVHFEYWHPAWCVTGVSL